MGWNVFASIKLYLIAAAVLAIGGLLFHDHMLAKRNKTLRVNLDTVTATLAGERKNRAIELEDRKHADEAAKSLQTKLDRIAAIPDPVGVYCRPAKLSTSASQSRAAASITSPSEAGQAEGPLRDIGHLLGEVRREAESNNAGHDELITWEIERTH